MTAPTTVARLLSDERTARRVADYLGESLDAEDTACAAFEGDDGQWQVAIHFRQAPDAAGLRELIALAAGESAAQAVTFEQVETRDWVAESLAGLKPVRAGRFVVHGAHDRTRVKPNEINIEIEAALAFGTGHHGTTRGCLLALHDLAKRMGRHPEVRAKRASKDGGRSSTDLGFTRDRINPAQVGYSRLAMGRLRRPSQDDGSRLRVLDVGTGSGVLAIAAAKRLRSRVVASDIDPLAVAAARANARLNGAPGIGLVCAAGVKRHALRAPGPYDLIFANILLGPLLRMARPLSRLAAPGGHIVLSGLLPAHAIAALAMYRAQGLVLVRRIPCEGWMTLVLRRP